jgi:hypothetical protein
MVACYEYHKMAGWQHAVNTIKYICRILTCKVYCNLAMECRASLNLAKSDWLGKALRRRTYAFHNIAEG